MTARTLLAAAALLAAALPAFPRQEPAKKDAPPQPPAKKDEVELKFAGVTGRGRASFRVEGQAPTLPDGAMLNAVIFRIEERAADGRIVTGGAQFHSEMVRVERKKFAYASPAGSPPGYYRATFRLLEEMQMVRPLKLLKEAGTLMPQEWTLDFPAWGDDLAGRLSKALMEVDALTAEAQELIGKFAQAAAQRPLWEANSKILDREASKLMQQIERSEAHRLYPAACGEISATVNTTLANARYITFRTDGMFDKIVDYHTGGKVVTYKDQEFNWDLMKKFLNESPEIGGREFALWVVKDTRRAGKVSDDLVKAVKEQAGHAGVSLYVNRLQQGERLDELEGIIRAKPK